MKVRLCLRKLLAPTIYTVFRRIIRGEGRMAHERLRLLEMAVNKDHDGLERHCDLLPQGGQFLDSRRLRRPGLYPDWFARWTETKGSAMGQRLPIRQGLYP